MLELTDGVTGRVVDLLRRAAIHAATTDSQRISLEVLQHVGSRVPTIISQRAYESVGNASQRQYLGTFDEQNQINPQLRNIR